MNVGWACERAWQSAAHPPQSLLSQPCRLSKMFGLGKKFKNLTSKENTSSSEHGGSSANVSAGSSAQSSPAVTPRENERYQSAVTRIPAVTGAPGLLRLPLHRVAAHCLLLSLFAMHAKWFAEPRFRLCAAYKTQ